MNIKYLITSTIIAFFVICGLSIFSVAQAECTGCGEEGHGICLEGADHSHDTIQEHEHTEGIWLDHKHEVVEEGAMSTPPEVVFAVCVFADGTLIDHKGANSMSDCLKTKREVEKAWRNRSDQTDSVEINGITYKIDGESLAFMCDLVDANVHHYEDGTWEIIQILGKHKKDE
tara:strand:+ start:161 stop:679 length:519 start_codon:yes stop_codon:yes gene_type:complete